VQRRIQFQMMKELKKHSMMTFIVQRKKIMNHSLLEQVDLRMVGNCTQMLISIKAL
jgi:hypothetical protein